AAAVASMAAAARASSVPSEIRMETPLVLRAPSSVAPAQHNAAKVPFPLGLAFPVIHILASLPYYPESACGAATLGQVLAGIRVFADLRPLHGADGEVLERCLGGIDDLVRVFRPRWNEDHVAGLQRQAFFRHAQRAMPFED